MIDVLNNKDEFILTDVAIGLDDGEKDKQTQHDPHLFKRGGLVEVGLG